MPLRYSACCQEWYPSWWCAPFKIKVWISLAIRSRVVRKKGCEVDRTYCFNPPPIDNGPRWQVLSIQIEIGLMADLGHGPRSIPPIFLNKGNILKTRVAYWELEFAHHGLQKLWGSHSTSSCFFHQPEVGPLTINPCRNRIRVATHRLHWWRGQCHLPLGHVSFWWKVSRRGGGFFRFFLICKYIQRYIQVFIANWLCKVFLLEDFKNYLLSKRVCIYVWKVILQGWI